MSVPRAQKEKKRRNPGNGCISRDFTLIAEDGSVAQEKKELQTTPIDPAAIKFSGLYQQEYAYNPFPIGLLTWPYDVHFSAS